MTSFHCSFVHCLLSIDHSPFSMFTCRIGSGVIGGQPCGRVVVQRRLGVTDGMIRLIGARDLPSGGSFASCSCAKCRHRTYYTCTVNSVSGISVLRHGVPVRPTPEISTSTEASTATLEHVTYTTVIQARYKLKGTRAPPSRASTPSAYHIPLYCLLVSSH
jgi:hypothetical protein